MGQKAANGMRGTYRLDRVFFTADTLKGEEIQVIGDQPFAEGLWPSDHYGLTAALSFL